MRLVRFARQPARVSDDVRAALASLGRGDSVTGGIALAGVQPPGCAKAVDAVLVAPHGVVIVVGIDLPDPAMRLDAPLGDQWKADGWPLVHPGGTAGAVNPATDAIALAGSVAERVRAAVPQVPIGVVLAVGPFVDSIEQPPADLSGPVRVIHPTPTSMLAATVSLAAAEEDLSLDAARALVFALAPEAPELTDAALTAEGFAEATEHPLAAAAPTVPVPHPGTPSATPVLTPPAPASPLPAQHAPHTPVRVNTPAPAAGPVAVGGRVRHVRWQGVAALVLLVGLALTAIVLAGSGERGNSAPAPERAPTVLRAHGFAFTQRAAAADTQCARHATGELQASLQETGCIRLWRASFDTTAGGRRIATSVAVVTFRDEITADAFLELADTPGSGAVTDLATATGRRPGRALTFAGAAYAADARGAIVRLVLSCDAEGPSDPDDERLHTVAEAALDLRVVQ